MRFNLVFAFANFTFLVFFVGLSQAEVDLDSLVGFWAFNEGAMLLQFIILSFAFELQTLGLTFRKS